ncbi:hypothetical protein [Miniphocaeibacter massiliensis]|uniref:hypothetical protein n=1 Tax=Miniphocaeibacter massiliensis TaxID=2041841 RepID=UPI000C086B2A|nr:hypothetical protein [Miniphocaeibacter massiliensis]
MKNNIWKDEIISKEKNIVVYKNTESSILMKKFTSNKELRKELKLYELMKKNNINLAFTISEILKDNSIVYSASKGKKLSLFNDINEEIYFKIGEELSKFHNIELNIRNEMEPIFYQVQILERLKKILKETQNETIKEAIYYIKEKLDKVNFKLIRFGISIYKISIDDILITETKEIKINNTKEICYNNQELNFVLLEKAMDESSKIESFFKGYSKNILLDEDYIERLKIFTLFSIISNSKYWEIEDKECYSKITNIKVRDIYKKT